MSTQLVPLTIAHAGGQRLIRAYTAPSITLAYETHATITRGNAQHTVYGDAGLIPEPLVVEAEITGSTLGQAYSHALQVVSECETATVVRSHWGDQPVDGLMSFSFQPAGHASVRARLEFAPASPVDDLVVFSVDRMVPTADSPTPTADTEWEPL